MTSGNLLDSPILDKCACTILKKIIFILRNSSNNQWLTFWTWALTTSPGSKLLRVHFCSSAAMAVETSEWPIDSLTTPPLPFTSSMMQFRYCPTFSLAPASPSPSPKKEKDLCEKDLNLSSAYARKKSMAYLTSYHVLLPTFQISKGPATGRERSHPNWSTISYHTKIWKSQWGRRVLVQGPWRPKFQCNLLGEKKWNWFIRS